MFAARAMMLTPPVVAAAPANVITNGTFVGTTGWASSVGFDGKSISGGMAIFDATGTFDGFQQTPITFVAGKFYQLTWTIVDYVSGTVFPQIFGGTATSGANRTANGTYVERILANTGSDGFVFQLSVSGTLNVENLSLIGPFNTSTVNGS
jgi:hypothetical protein